MSKFNKGLPTYDVSVSLLQNDHLSPFETVSAVRRPIPPIYR